MIEVFTPTGNTVSVTATVASAVTALGTLSSLSGGTIRVYNSGTSICFINFGTSGSTASITTSMPIPAGAIEVFQLGAGVTHVATITSSGTAVIYFTPGQGN